MSATSFKYEGGLQGGKYYGGSSLPDYVQVDPRSERPVVTRKDLLREHSQSNAQHRRGLLRAALMANKSPAVGTTTVAKTKAVNSPTQNTEELMKNGAIFDYMPWSKKGAQKKRSLTSSRYGNR
jgi:hypothetical protein